MDQQNPSNSNEIKVNAFTLDKEYAEKYKNGMEFSAIRAEMQAREIEPEVISAVMRSLNNKILQNNLSRVQHRKVNSKVITGLCLASVGTLIMALTYNGTIPMGSYYLVPYGAIIGGFGLFLAGIAGIRN